MVVALLLLESLTLVLPVRGDDPSSGASLSSQWLPNLTSEAFSRAGGEENGQEQHHSDGTATSTDDENRPERYYNDGTPLSIEELDKEVRVYSLHCHIYIFFSKRQREERGERRGANRPLMQDEILDHYVFVHLLCSSKRRWLCDPVYAILVKHKEDIAVHSRVVFSFRSEFQILSPASDPHARSHLLTGALASRSRTRLSGKLV